MAQGNVTQASGHAYTLASGSNALKYRTTNSGNPLAHNDVDANFELLRVAVNGIVSDINGVVDKDVLTNVPTGAVFTDTTYSAGSGISLSSTTFSHTIPSTVALTSNNTGRTYIQSVGVDTFGHVTGLTTGTATDTWNANTKTVAGYVAAPGTSGGDKVWGTDSAGTPAWRASQTGGMSFNSSTGVLTISSTATLGGGAVAKYSTGWQNSIDSVTVANGSTHTVTHSLGTTDVLVNVYVNSSASDTNAQQIHSNLHVSGGQFDCGALVTSLSSNSLELQLGQDGYNDITSAGGFMTTSLANKYIKVVVIGE